MCRRSINSCGFAFLALWLVTSCYVFCQAQVNRRDINKAVAIKKPPKKPTALIKVASDQNLTDCLASSNAPKPSVNRTPAKTAAGYLISDCEPMALVILYQPQLSYPRLAVTAKASGVVRVEVVIDEDGRVIWAQVVEGHPLLRSAALRAACQTRIKPVVDCIGRRLKPNTILCFNFEPKK